MTTKKSRAVPRSQGIRYRYATDGSLRGYEVRYRDPARRDKHGKPVVRGKTFRTLEQAKAFQTETAHQIKAGSYIAPEREATTWKQVSDEWLAGHRVNLRARSVQGYEGVLARWLNRWGHRPIGSLTRADVRGLLSDVRGRGRAEETEHRIFNVASAVFAYAVQEDYIRTSPAAAVRKELRSPTKKTFKAHHLTKDEALRIVNALPEGRNRLFGLVGFWTGFRAGELAGLRVRNIDAKHTVLQVDETIEDLGGVLRPGVPKTARSRGRRVPIPRAVLDELLAYVADQRLKPDAYVFGLNGRMFHYQNWRNRCWLPACKRADFWVYASEEDATAKKGGKPTVRFYDLRHTFASLRAAEGVPPHTLMQWMGHSTITTTMNIYSHVYDGDERMEAIVERLYGDQPEPGDEDGPTAA